MIGTGTTDASGTFSLTGKAKIGDTLGISEVSAPDAMLFRGTVTDSGAVDGEDVIIKATPTSTTYTASTSSLTTATATETRTSSSHTLTSTSVTMTLTTTSKSATMTKTKTVSSEEISAIVQQRPVNQSRSLE